MSATGTQFPFFGLFEFCEVDVWFGFWGGRTFEGLIEGHGFAKKPAIAQIEPLTGGAAGVIEALAFAGGGVTSEARGGDLMPCAAGIADPLIAMQSAAAEEAVFVVKVFEERMKAGQMFICFRSFEAGDELPVCFPGLAEPRGIDCVPLAVGLGGVEEAVGGPGFPWENEIALTS